MKYDANEEYIKVLMENIGNLLLLPQYLANTDYRTATKLFNAMNPLCFQKPTEKELKSYIAHAEQLKPNDPIGIQAVNTAIQDLLYLLRLKG